MNRFIITAGSTFDLPSSLVQEYGIKVFPSHICMGNSYLPDYPNVREDALFDYYKRTGTLPRIAAANSSTYFAFFNKYTHNDTAVIHIAKSAGISSCCANAVLAAGSLRNVYVIDSKSVSGGSALLAIAATEQREGDTLQSLITRICEYRERIGGSFIIESLECLREGGRCYSISYLGANALQLKPCIIIRDGKMSVGKKYRGSYRRCLFEFIEDRLSRLDLMERDNLFIAHSICHTTLMMEIYQYILTKKIFTRVIVSSAVTCY